ncbi:MAG: HAMP domain-containing histidine kinase [Chloroflexi bacterium]|nr:HAMP domain-containing histidine kinase [Chloroflexota bacterium]
MFTSLRSRLWSTYVLIVIMVLAVCSVGLIYALRQSPLLYRQVINQIDVSSELLVRRLNPLVDRSRERFIQAFQTESRDIDTNVALFDRNGQFLATNIAGSEIALQLIAQQVDFEMQDGADVSLFAGGERNKDWFYTVRSLGDNYYVLTAMIKPVFQFSTIVKDEFMSPLLQAGAIVLIFAFFISLIISNWIALPLKHITQSAEALSEGDLVEIPLEGPKEVQQLASTFNLMSKKITAGAQSQREFVANVSHELKTPLTSIQGYAQAILDGTVESKPAIDKAANVILIETNRLHRLVMDLLTLARLEAGTANIQHSEVHIQALLANMVDKFSIQAEKQAIQLHIDRIPDVVIMGDGDRFAQVFSNLIDNALKFTPEKGQVRISAEIANQDIMIKVADTGLGIPEVDREKIFDRFYQSETSRKYGKKKGFGLGLSIAREIIQSHHGKIWVEDNAGRGSVFVVKLPIHRNKS